MTIEQNAPRIPDNARRGNACCTWDTFRVGFVDAWPRWFKEPPSERQWKCAVSDWRAGNTGWEAAHNAQAREKDAARSAAHRAWEKSGAIISRAAKQ